MANGLNPVEAFQRGALGRQQLQTGGLQQQILKRQLEQQDQAARQQQALQSQRQGILGEVFSGVTGNGLGQVTNAPVAQGPNGIIQGAQRGGFGGLVIPDAPTLAPEMQQKLLSLQLSTALNPQEVQAITQFELSRGGDPVAATKRRIQKNVSDASRALAAPTEEIQNQLINQRILEGEAEGLDMRDTALLLDIPFEQRRPLLETVVAGGAGAEEIGKSGLKRQEQREKDKGALRLENSKQAGRLELDEEKFERERSIRELDRELEVTGDKFEKAGKIRTELQKQPQIADFNKIESSFGRVKAAAEDPSPAGDLALIFNFMKMLDPGSVVRESEFATAENSGSVPTRIVNLYNKTLTGQRLGKDDKETDNIRTDFVARSKKLFKSQEKLTKRIENEFVELAKDSGLERDDVVLRGRSIPAASQPFTSSSGITVEVE